MKMKLRRSFLQISWRNILALTLSFQWIGTPKLGTATVILTGFIQSSSIHCIQKYGGILHGHEMQMQQVSKKTSGQSQRKNNNKGGKRKGARSPRLKGRDSRGLVLPRWEEEAGKDDSSSFFGWSEGRPAQKQPVEKDATPVIPPQPASPLDAAVSTIKCSHFKKCPGCKYDSALDHVPIALDAKGFCEMYSNKPFQIFLGPTEGWRTQAKLAVKQVSRWGGCTFGLYQAASHDVVDIPDCVVHHPAINKAVETLKESTKRCKILAYNEDKMEGMLRYVQMAVERSTGKVQLTLVWNAASFKESVPHLQLLVKDLKKRNPELWHSIWANFRVGYGNTIFNNDPKKWHLCHGPGFLREQVGPQNINFYLAPMSFRQGNLDAFSTLVERIEDWVPDDSRVCELYSGVGIIGLNIAHKAEWVRCSDISPSIPRSFDKTVQKLPAEIQKKVSYESFTAEEAFDYGECDDATVLIVDPPRKGLDEGVLERLNDVEDASTQSLSRIIYVSCGFDALKMDSLRLFKGGWKMTFAEGHILFPGSDHIETLAIFDRENTDALV